MVKLKYTGLRNGEDKYSFLFSGRRFEEGQELTDDDLKLFDDVNLGCWKIIKTKKTKVVNEVEEEIEEEEEVIKIR